MILSDILAARQFDPLQQQRNIAGKIQPADTIKIQAPTTEKSEENKNTFASTLREFIGDVNQSQVDSADSTEKLIKGEPVDIHDVMISAEKAKTSFQLLLELRNKALDLYRESIRIQV